MMVEEYGVERSDGSSPAGGKPPPVDAASAARTSNVQACSLGNSAACYQAGLACEAGSGGPRDLFEARRHFQKGCDGGFDLACFQLGTYLMSGMGGPEDKPLGRAMLMRSCKAGIKQACQAPESR
jgi:hypothetical protein